jgi:predicted metal-binding membrane protein
MERVQKALLISLIVTSALAWIASVDQPDMMVAMASYNPLAISLFTASWTTGMAAMMFPAITPMVLMYNRLITNKQNNRGGQSSVTIHRRREHKDERTSSFPSIRIILFVGLYLLVWALTGVALLLGLSVVMNNTIMTTGNTSLVRYLYGALLITAGVYQFTPLKRICIGYCESPISFFMRRWRDGPSGAVTMGLYHGMYCLGCCWAYFLLMVALGWMNLLWMGLFAGIIFGEKIWSKGIWIARAAGVGLIIVGMLFIANMFPSTMSAVTSMGDIGNDTDAMTMVSTDDNVNNNESNNMGMSNASTEASMSMSDNSSTSVIETGASDESDPTTSSYDVGRGEPMGSNNSNKEIGMMEDMK